MSEPIFMFQGDAPEMQRAYEAARKTFRCFWRELYWERRRIVPALDLAVIKLPFTDGPRDDGHPEFEHMWVDDVRFDGLTLKGSLLNSPNWLTSVEEGDAVEAPFGMLTDWMFAIEGKACGGYTVNVMRAGMSPAERKSHDDAWGLNFGDPFTVRAEIEKTGAKPSALPSGAFRDHPMCLNMVPKIEEQLRADPSIPQRDLADGWTVLHVEAMAGNLEVVRLLVRYGADIGAKTNDGRTAADLAGSIGWVEIASYLANEASNERL